MDMTSWIRRSLSKTNTKTQNQHQPQKTSNPQQQQQQLGVTEQLIAYAKSFTLDTFKNFPLQDDNEATAASSGNVSNDLSWWQQQHAMLVLSKVKELSQLRFKLCPGHMKERQFWRIYFMLVKSHVAEYELHAIRVAKLKQMDLEDQNSLDIGACEVEMSETKQIIYSNWSLSAEDYKRLIYGS
ncbi:BSD domain-containing protein [Cephalotus follicularis]|uniref:BSD domain-containing protein n=1 Tax=Cephalotus follicularis TaxID=3775 RepID=A0A1Q3BRX8_CEPFO|nr:BSD domain-containing protein [Cephalotus follicularis]